MRGRRKKTAVKQDFGVLCIPLFESLSDIYIYKTKKQKKKKEREVKKIKTGHRRPGGATWKMEKVYCATWRGKRGRGDVE